MDISFLAVNVRAVLLVALLQRATQLLRSFKILTQLLHVILSRCHGASLGLNIEIWPTMISLGCFFQERAVEMMVSSPEYLQCELLLHSEHQGLDHLCSGLSQSPTQGHPPSWSGPPGWGTHSPWNEKRHSEWHACWMWNRREEIFSSGHLVFCCFLFLIPGGQTYLTHLHTDITHFILPPADVSLLQLGSNSQTSKTVFQLNMIHRIQFLLSNKKAFLIRKFFKSLWRRCNRTLLCCGKYLALRICIHRKIN